MVKMLNMSLKSIEITDIVESVYYARLHFITDESKTYSLDARPSDAIALALRMEAPIYVDTLVLDKSKDMDLSAIEGKDGGKALGGNSLDLLEELSPEDFGKYKM